MSLPLPRTLTLRRTGTIRVRVAGRNHIGAESAVQDGTVPVRYTIELTTGADGLNEQGFLVDQELLHDLMTDIGMDPVPWTNSGELLTFVWGYRVLKWISTTNTRCVVHSLDLTLSPAPNAGSFTAHFDNIAAAPVVGLSRPLRLVA